MDKNKNIYNLIFINFTANQTGKSKSLSILQPVLYITTTPHERKTKLEKEVKRHLKLQYVKTARLQLVFNLNFTILHSILYIILHRDNNSA
jgi:hypothetical protein